MGAAIVSHVAVGDRGKDRGPALEHVGRVLASEHRVEEPAIAKTILLSDRVSVCLRVLEGVHGDEVERDPDLRVRAGAQDVDCAPVGQEQMMRRREGVCPAPPTRRMLP